MDNPVFWWHLKPRLHESIDRYMQVADRYPEMLDRGVRRALGFLGVILEEFRFSCYRQRQRRHVSGVLVCTGSRQPSSVPCYPHLLKWTEPMQDTIRDYDAVYVKALALFWRFKQLKEEKKRQDALEPMGLNLSQFKSRNN